MSAPQALTRSACTVSQCEACCLVQGKRIGVISSIVSNPNNDPEITAKFAQAMADLQAGGNDCCPSSHLSVSVQKLLS